MQSFFECEMAPVDPILSLSVAFKLDTHPSKVDLGVGAYRDGNGLPYVFTPVRQAQAEIAADPNDNHEYSLIDGHSGLKMATLRVLLGEKLAKEHSSRIVSSQAISGTGALRLASEFLFSCHGPRIAYVSDPTWSNHRTIFDRAHFESVEAYPYWDSANKCLNMSGWLRALESAPRGSVIVLHACAHNPTGCDPTPSQWKSVVEVIVRRGLLALADSAYQGYASGDLDADAFLIHELLQAGAEFIVTQSFAKNMGLYGERFGMIHIVTKSSSVAECALSQLKTVIRPMYSSPPIYGAKIALRVLTTPLLYTEWLDELKAVSGRVATMRTALAKGLALAAPSVSWEHIGTQIGMFSYTGLTPQQVDRMTQVWHIYMLRNGRISLAGLNEKNLHYVIDAIVDCHNVA